MTITTSSPLPETAQFSTPSPAQTCKFQMVSMLLILDRFWSVDGHPRLSFSWMVKARRSGQLLLPKGMD
ncbi:hypothetical protein DPMN_114613 [Dreissena polymorpha]|uniref:Uncharacterized protein n=1 Tax=Dreissena polymorpha TaxID=45954 RepID=A0A9D4QT06_DREPO|nr:hypothetical protein DPMN_114613 [Dreissena polymorpha]